MARKRKNKKKGDLAINTVMVIFVAIISILLLLALFGGKLPTFAKQLYCMTFFHIQSKTFVPEGIRTDTSYCSRENNLGTHYLFPDDQTLREFSDGSLVKRHQGANPLSLTVSLPEALLTDARLDLVLISAEDGSGTALSEATAELVVAGDPLGERATALIKAEESGTLNFTEQLNRTLHSCASYPCDRQFIVSFSPPVASAKFAVQHLSLVVNYCDVDDEILGAMIACWERSKNGRLSKDLLCDEITLAPDCNDTYPLTSQEIADKIRDEKLCDYLPNGAPCAGDKVDFELTEVNKRTNVLVEYISSNKRIKVS